MSGPGRGVVRPAMAGARRPFFRRRKTCPFSGPGAPKIDYKDVRQYIKSICVESDHYMSACSSTCVSISTPAAIS